MQGADVSALSCHLSLWLRSPCLRLSLFLSFSHCSPAREDRNQIPSNSLPLALYRDFAYTRRGLHNNRNKFGYRGASVPVRRARGCRLLAIVGRPRARSVVHKPRGISSKSRREFRVCRAGERQKEEAARAAEGHRGRRWRRRGTLLEVLRNKLRAFRETFALESSTTAQRRVSSRITSGAMI